MERKKTVFVVTWFYPDQPGFMDFSYRIRALAHEYSVTVIARDAIVQEELRIPEARYVVISTRTTSKSSLLFYQARVAAVLRRRRPAGVVLLGSQVSAVALLLRDIPCLVYWNEHPSHFADSNPRRPLKNAGSAFVRQLAYAGARAANRVMPIGEAHRDELLTRGVQADKTTLIHMGVQAHFENSLEASLRTPDELLRIVYTGSVSRERGRDVMLEGLAIANRERPVATLTLVGASVDEATYCRQRAEALGVDRFVFVHGRVPGYSVPRYLSEADVGVCIWADRVYWQFNPPTKLFEYLVAGLPVLASDIRTHTQYVSHWHNGIIFEYDAHSFARAVTELWSRRSELPQLRDRARRSGEPYKWARIEPVFMQAVSEEVDGTSTTSEANKH